MEDPQKKVTTYLNQMNNYDPDLQEMGAKYLSQLIQKGKVNLKQDAQLARKITENFLKQVASSNFVVHSSAIRQLADMVPYIPKDQLVHIFHQIISAIAKINTPSQRRQVFSTSAGTMIHHAPQQLGIVISDLFVQSIDQLLKLKGQNTDIQMLLLNVITEFARKWPNVAGNAEVKFDRKSLLLYLMKIVQTSPKLLLVRKADAAMSKLSIIFNKQNFQLLFNNKQFSLLSFMRKQIQGTEQQQLKKLRNAIVSIANISKVHNPDMRPWVQQISGLAIQIINFHKDKDNYLELETQIVQNSITTLTYLIRGFASEMHTFMAKGTLNSFIEECLNFDPEGMMSYKTQAMDIQEQFEDEQEFYNEDTVCWKVRSATLRYVTTLMHKDKLFRESKVKQKNFLSILASKLIQQNQNVSRMGFQSFNYIIQSISVPKDISDQQNDMQLKKVKSSEGDFAMDIVRQISNQIQLLFKDKKTKQDVKTQASRTLLRIIQLLKDRIIQHQQINMQLLNLIQNLATKVKVENCVNLLKAIKSLLSPSIQFKEIQKLIDLLLSYVNNKNLKVVAASFTGIRAIIKQFPEQLHKSNKFTNVITAILNKLKQHDADKHIKSSVLKCLGPIYEKMFLMLSQQNQRDILSASLEKLKIQIDKSLVLFQISKIPINYKLNGAQVAIGFNLLKQASQSLGTINYQLNANAIQCCDKLIRIQNKAIDQNTVVDILNRSRPMINDHKIPKFVNLLLQTHPKSFKNFSELIIRTTQVYYVVKLVQLKIVDLGSAIIVLKSVAKPENYKNISIILSELKVSQNDLIKDIGDNDFWGLICLGALGYIGNLKTADYLLTKINDDSKEEVKLQASKSLGNIASRHHQLVKQILNHAIKSQDNYLFIVSLKETIIFSKKQFPGLTDILHFMLKQSKQSNRQTYQYVISESIGRALVISQKQLVDMLNSVNKMSPQELFILASAFKYAIENYPNSELSIEFQEYLETVAKFIDNKDVNVRYAALKSLNSIVNTHRTQIKSIITDKLIEQILENMTIKAELIIIVDYGVNKQKKDLGRPLRIQAFNLIRSILEYSKVQNYSEQIVKKCIEKLNQQTSNDLILKRVNIIRRMCQKDFTAFIPHQNQLAKTLGIQQGVLKAHQKQTQMDDERNQGYLKNLLKQILLIRQISDNESSDVIRALVNHIKSSERLNKIIDAIQIEA